MATTFEDLEKIELFNIKKEDFENRFIPLFPIFRENWEMYIDTEKGLLPLKIVDRTDGFYISKNYVKTDDLYLLFFNVMFKRNNFKVNMKPLMHIYDDIYNLCASVEKINFFSEIYNKEDHFKLCKYASVELESIFQNSRAIFENLQKIQDYLMLSTISANNDDFFSIKKIRYEKNFTLEEYMKKYKIPEIYAKFYVNTQDFFFFILDMRNDIFHSRKSFKLFLGDEGFSISLNEYDLKKLHFWNKTNTLKNDLGSLKSLVSYIVLNTIVVLEEYAKTINSIIKLSDDILPKYNLYIRSDFNKILKELYTYADDSSWNKKDKN